MTAGLRRAALFTGVSGLVWLLDASVLLALTQLAFWPPTPAALAGSTCGALLVFSLSGRVVFRPDGAPRGPKVAALVAVNAAVILCAARAVALIGAACIALARSRGWPLPDWAAWLAAKIVVTPFTLALNFVFVRFLVERFARTAPGLLRART